MIIDLVEMEASQQSIDNKTQNDSAVHTARHVEKVKNVPTGLNQENP